MSHALDLMDIGHHYRQYLRLMARWKTLFGDDIVEVSYDALVRDPKSQLEQVLGSLGTDYGTSAVPTSGRDAL